MSTLNIKNQIAKVFISSLLSVLIMSCSNEDRIGCEQEYDLGYTFYIDFVKDGESVIFNSPSLFDDKGKMEIVCPYTFETVVERSDLNKSTLTGVLIDGKCYLKCSGITNIRTGRSEEEWYLFNGAIKTKINIPLLNQNKTDVVTIDWSVNLQHQHGPFINQVAYNAINLNGANVGSKSETDDTIPMITIEVE